MPPWGGREGLLGTNPFAAGAPGGKLGPYLLDMSPAVAARGKIRRAERRGEKIPLGYALDGDGRPTTDPTAALGGVVLPIGGYKGSGLSMLMDIFGGVISGAGFAGQDRVPWRARLEHDRLDPRSRPLRARRYRRFRGAGALDQGVDQAPPQARRRHRSAPHPRSSRPLHQLDPVSRRPHRHRRA